MPKLRDETDEITHDDIRKVALPTWFLITAAAVATAFAVAAVLWVSRPAEVRLVWDTHPITAGDPKAERAGIDAGSLANLVEVYRLSHDRLPDSLDALTTRQPDGKPPLCEGRWVVDPWGKKWQLRQKDGKAEVFTVTPAGKEIAAEIKQPTR